MEEVEGDSYYAVLNVSRDASTEEVRRAYRNLAQVFHPDKQLDPTLKGAAQETFGKLQEAHEILCDTTKRQIYDVYGKQGLSAGFEVGPSYAGLPELKKQWEEFKRKQESERQEAASNHRGSYMCRMDATEYRQVLQGRAPLFRALSISNSVDAPIGDGGDVITLQGQAALRNQAGTGNLIFGYKRVISTVDSLDMSAILGLRPQFNIISSRQLSPYTSASLATTYGLHEGWGLQFSSVRQLPYDCTSTYSWVLGPKGATGMSLSLARRGAKFGLGGKLEVGSVTALSARLNWVISDSVNVRVVMRCGTTGIDLEMGAHKRWSPQAAGYLGAVVGLQGVLVKTRYIRAGQTFEVPILMSSHYSDWRVAAAAYVLPPLAYIATSRLIVRPVAAYLRERRRKQEQAEYADEVNAGLKSAAIEQRLLAPVARRKARVEAQRKSPAEGLVILQALYGVFDPAVLRQRLQHLSLPTTTATTASSAPTEAGTSSSQDPSKFLQDFLSSRTGEGGSQASRGEAASPASSSASVPADGSAQNSASKATANGGDSSGGGSSGWSWWRTSTPTPHVPETPAAATANGGSSRPHVPTNGHAEEEQGSGASSSSAASPASKASSTDPALPDQWMDVTSALQYLVTDGKLVLHPGVAKSGLMGFADPAPAAELKRLYVAYWHQGKVWEVAVDDEGGLVLPGVPAQGPTGRAASTSASATAPTNATNTASPPASSSPQPHQTSPSQQQPSQPDATGAKQQAPGALHGVQGQCVTDPELALRMLQAGGATWGLEVSPDGKGLVLPATESS